MPGRIVIFPAACGASFPTISQLLALAVPVEIRLELPNGSREAVVRVRPLLAEAV